MIEQVQGYTMKHSVFNIPSTIERQALQQDMCIRYKMCTHLQKPTRGDPKAARVKEYQKEDQHEQHHGNHHLLHNQQVKDGPPQASIHGGTNRLRAPVRLPDHGLHHIRPRVEEEQLVVRLLAVVLHTHTHTYIYIYRHIHIHAYIYLYIHTHEVIA